MGVGGGGASRKAHLRVMQRKIVKRETHEVRKEGCTLGKEPKFPRANNGRAQGSGFQDKFMTWRKVPGGKGGTKWG